MSDGKQEKNASFKAIFEDEDEVYAESFRDRVRAIHEHFDRDQDGYLNYQELSDLQQATSGSPLADGDQYVMICRTLECKPNQGISVEALRLTYASDGTNLEDDYFKVFPNKKRHQEKKKKATPGPKEGEGEQIYEVGENGVDISP